MVADTSGLLALFNRREPAHAAVAAFVGSADEVLVVSPYVLAELDYLLATRAGSEAELAVLRELSGGAFALASLEAEDVMQAVEVIERYADLGIGIADASLVVLAARFGTRTILTLDRRHFAVLRPLDGGRFKIVP
ncbi:MAG: PIN domain-containing protein [Acidimicrobiia bacterium]|nr:PIN domain-containing protein [Acidimicrobiia bacterium]